MSLEYRIGDVVERLAEIPDDSIDLIVTSPPFLALRSYLPADHPDKHREIGSEPTPAAFIDTMLHLSAEWFRVLAPHGSLCVELGDTYSGVGGGSTTPNPAYGASRSMERAETSPQGNGKGWRTAEQLKSWPLAKSLTGIPTLYTWSLAYGRNLLTGEESPAGQARIRNLIVWARPNPPVGALGDKYRPATSYITVACKGAKRYFDLDAVRTEHKVPEAVHVARKATQNIGAPGQHTDPNNAADGMLSNPAGAPPLDWHADDHPEDGDWLWKLSTQPYKGSHYATFPLTLPKRLIESMCPQKVCTTCGKPSERITERTPEYAAARAAIGDMNTHRDGVNDAATGNNGNNRTAQLGKMTSAEHITLGWTDCGHNTWRTGIVLDPFAGSGTTLEAAQAVGRHAIGIDLDERNAELAQQRVGMFMTIDGDAA